MRFLLAMLQNYILQISQLKNLLVLTIVFTSISQLSYSQSWQQSYNQAIQAYSENDFAITLSTAEQALTQASSNDERLFTLKLLSVTCYETGDFNKGIEYAKKELALCKETTVPDSVYSNSLSTMVNNLLGKEDFEQAIDYSKELVSIVQKYAEPTNLELNQYKSDLGYAYLMVANYELAINTLKEANQYLINHEDGVEDFLYNQLNIGQAYYQSGSLVSALSTFQSLEDILKSNELDSYQIYAEVLEGEALVYSKMENFAKAEESYEVASNKYQSLGYGTQDLQALNEQLAVIYLKTGNSAKSDSVTALYGASANNQNLIINQITLAYSQFANAEYELAAQTAEKVLSQVRSSTSDQDLFAEALMLDARISLKRSSDVNITGISKAVEIFETLQQNPKLAEAKLVESKVYLYNGNTGTALESLLEAKAITVDLNEEFLLKYNVMLDLLGLYIQTKQIAAANKSYSEVISTGMLSKSEFEGQLAINYGILLQAAGYNLEAKKVLEQRISATSYPNLLQYQQALAKVYLDLGQIKESLKLYRSINDYLEQEKLTASTAYGENLVQIGRVNVMLGDYGKAEGYYANAIKILESNDETPSSALAATYNSYAIFQQTIGNFDKAKLYYSKAKFFSEENLNLQIDIIQNLATLSQYEESYEDAIILYKEALPMYGSLYGKNHPYYATALQNLANAYNKNGDPVKGIELIEKALEIDKNNGLDVSNSYTNKLHNLAILLQEVDELDRSKAILVTVLANRRNLLGENHPDYIYTLYNLAVLNQKMGDFESAKKYFRQSIAKYDFQIESFFPYLSEQEKSKYYSKIKEAFVAFQDFAAEYAATDPTIIGDLYNFQLNHKAILLKSSRSIKAAIERSNDQELIGIYNDWLALKTNLAKYYSMSQQELSLANINLDEVANHANALEKSLSLKSELFETSMPGDLVTWQKIQSKLKADEAAIEIIRIKKNIRNDSIWYGALIVKPNMPNPQLVLFENGRFLEDRFIKLYKNSIRFKRKDTESFNAFWKPIHDNLSGIKMIYLSTDGVYNKLNISSLLDPENDLYVLDELIIHNVTNTSDITLATSDITLDDNFILDLIGNPNFTATESDDFDISDLPGTGIEVATIDSLAKTSNIDPIILTGNGASEANLKNLESPNILHIATHGFFLTDNTVSEDMYSIESNPLMRSGLLLSGSQHSFRGNHINFDGSLAAEDGILTAYEAMNLDLSQADLVVLSACETGLGEVKNGEGVYGLQRSFAIAGAKSVLISLWKVDDNSTKELMILFYKNILNGIDKFEALNMAQKELKSKYDLPYYWGAFVLSGI